MTDVELRELAEVSSADGPPIGEGQFVASHPAVRHLHLARGVLRLLGEKAELNKQLNGTLAERLFRENPAERELGDALDDIFGWEAVDDTTWDSYDRSLEVYIDDGWTSVLTPEVLARVHVRIIDELGFGRYWIHPHRRDRCPRRIQPIPENPDERVCHALHRWHGDPR